MASIHSTARDAIYPLIETHFAVSTIFNVSDADRVNFRFLIEAAEESAVTINVSLPYAVVAWGSNMPTGDFTCNSDDYTQDVTVFYLASTRSAGDAKNTRTLLTDLEDKARAFVDAARAASSGFQVIENAIDVSNTNEANSYFLSHDLPVYGVVVRLKILLGEDTN